MMVCWQGDCPFLHSTHWKIAFLWQGTWNVVSRLDCLFRVFNLHGSVSLARVPHAVPASQRTATAWEDLESK